jgi:hypothetical protein
MVISNCHPRDLCSMIYMLVQIGECCLKLVHPRHYPSYLDSLSTAIRIRIRVHLRELINWFNSGSFHPGHRQCLCMHYQTVNIGGSDNRSTTLRFSPIFCLIDDAHQNSKYNRAVFCGFTGPPIFVHKVLLLLR